MEDGVAQAHARLSLSVDKQKRTQTALQGSIRLSLSDAADSRGQLQGAEPTQVKGFVTHGLHSHAVSYFDNREAQWYRFSSAL
jgi:hypothetical protein